MRAAEDTFLLLLFSSIGLGDAHPQYDPGSGDLGEGVAKAATHDPRDTGCPADTHECVYDFLCIEGEIVSPAEAIAFDVTIKTEKECSHPNPVLPAVCCRMPNQTCPESLECMESERCKISVYPADLLIPFYHTACSVGQGLTRKVGMCCHRLPPSPFDVCPGNQVCLPEGKCKGGTGVAGATTTATHNDCFIDKANQVLGICCDPSTSVIDACPGNGQCMLERLCHGEALNIANDYVLRSSGGSWKQCALKGSQQNSAEDSVCCRNPAVTEIINKGIQCGYRSSGSIQLHLPFRQGVAFGEFPWQAILFYSNFTFKCGASLVADRWLITAAHCVSGYQSQDFKIRLGEWQVDITDEPWPHLDLDVASITVHPEFKQDGLHNDIALIELADRLKYETHIRPVCLPTDEEAILQPGTRCLVTGWGKDAFDGAPEPRLKMVDVPFVEHGHCQDLLRKTRLGRFFVLDRSFMCAGGEANNDVCALNGSGPLVCEDKTTGTYFLHGVTAWNINCGQKDVPIVHADVRFFKDWINNLINGSQVVVEGDQSGNTNAR